MLIFFCLLDDLILGFCCSNLTRESVGLELASTVTFALQANRLTKCASHPNFYPCSPAPVKTLPQVLIITPTRQREEINHSPREDFFENLFPPTIERGGGNYDSTRKYSIKIQSEIQSENRKMTWKIRLFIFCMICSF